MTISAESVFSLPRPGIRRSRRTFLQAAAAVSTVAVASGEQPEAGPNVFGPRPGYSPQLGTLVSEMNWMREAVLRSAKGMRQQELDFLLDARANRMGALLLHLAATEKLYQLNTFDGLSPDAIYKDAAFQEWSVPMELGEPGRQAVKGHELDYYVDRLREGREKTLAEFRKRDDRWLLAVDSKWPWGPTNNLCKWFHVCEHESHHAGQISLIRTRVPGAKPDNG